MTKQTAPILITGVNGFVGKHLVREISQNNISVIGVGRESTADPEISELLQEYVNVDLAKDWPKTGEVSAVIHLAGLAAVGPSFEKPQDYLNLNSAMVTNMCEYYLTQTIKPRIVVVSSGAIYDPNRPMPLTEDSEISFYSPYAVSKVLVEHQCAYYRNRGLDCVVVRPFNHIGPGQSRGFLVPDVVSQLRVGNTVTVGNISTKRDYTDVRDIVRAYRLLATTSKLNHGVYNACSGISTSGEQIINLLKEALEKPSAEVIVDQSRVRPTDPVEIYGDASCLSGDTGWVPEIKLEQTLLDIVSS